MVVYPRIIVTLDSSEKSPSVYIGHGRGNVKRSMEPNGRTDPTALTGPGHPLYSLMFAETEPEKSNAVTARPELGEIVAVVGNLESDAVAANLPRRAEIRKQFGFEPGETVVFVLSTFGTSIAFGIPWATLSSRRCES